MKAPRFISAHAWAKHLKIFSRPRKPRRNRWRLHGLRGVN